MNQTLCMDPMICMVKQLAIAMRYVAIAIASSRRLGWIALGLYIQRMNLTIPMPGYKTSLEYHRAICDDYYAVETTMAWADDFRMIMFNELVKRMEAIDDTWDALWIKEERKRLVMKKAQRARLELENAWLN